MTTGPFRCSCTAHLRAGARMLAILALAACDGGSVGGSGGSGDGGGGGDPTDAPSAPELPDAAGVVWPADAAPDDSILACPGGPLPTIGAAIAAAPSGATILVCPGTYPEVLVIDGKSLVLRATGGAAATIIDAGGVASALTVRGGAVVGIDGLTLRGGVAELGGGVHVTGATLAMRASVITGNRARVRGGGIYVDGEALIEDTTIAANTSGWTAGGIYLAGHAPVLRRVTVTGNQSENDGGGIYLHQSPATIEDSTIADNSSGDDGAGIRGFTSQATFTRNVIERNHSGNDGGGIKVSHLPCQITDNVIRDNTAVGSGGGIELDNDSSQVRGGEISGNTAARGGGIHASLWPWADGLIEGVVLRGNHADRGGGLDVEDNFQPLVARELTIVGNTADRGAGVYARSTNLTLTRSLIANNTGAWRGGGLFVRANHPWSGECPCPPSPPALDVSFVTVYGNEASEGAGLWTDATGLTLSNAIVAGNRGATSVAVAAPVDVPGATRPRPTWRFVDTTPATFAGMNDPTGNDGNLAADPAFVAADAGDVHLASGSACLDAGDPGMRDADGSRADMGRFGGP